MSKILNQHLALQSRDQFNCQCKKGAKGYGLKQFTVFHFCFLELAGSVIWIGGQEVGRKWYWMDGRTPRAITIADWAPGQPEYHNNQCLFLAESHWRHRWHDAPCEQSRSYICERPF